MHWVDAGCTVSSGRIVMERNAHRSSHACNAGGHFIPGSARERVPIRKCKQCVNAKIGNHRDIRKQQGSPSRSTFNIQTFQRARILRLKGFAPLI
jgi:hypothetical protein